jgi:2',3'-cyclic-nucleotide 2'-phosphodiesterase/3'-nucleotidase
VAEARVPLDGARGRLEDSALADAIHEVQLHYARAQVSFTALRQTAVAVPSGPVTRRALADLCVHDDELCAVEGDGRMVRAALENAARYFRGWPEASSGAVPLVDRATPGYNYDTAAGVEYEIDLTRPVGSHVRNLRYLGAPLRDDEPLRIALSSYRVRGSAGYSMFRGAKVVYRSGRAIRELLAEYWGARGRLREKPDSDWRMQALAA